MGKNLLPEYAIRVPMIITIKEKIGRTGFPISPLLERRSRKNASSFIGHDKMQLNEAAFLNHIYIRK